MDRDEIERRDFPTGRRGYDPAAVDEHLRRVADELDARVHPPAPTLADSTSEQVRLILEAAERGAAELRAQAGEAASDHVARVQAAADGMLAKLDALESELSRLLAALRTSGERLVEGLAELQDAATRGLVPGARPAGVLSPPAAAPPASEAAAPPPTDVSPDDATTSPAPEAASSAAAAPPTDVSPDDATTSPAPDSPPLSAPGASDWPAPPDIVDTLFAPPEEEESAPASVAPDEDDAGARLIALNMALSGSPRADTKAYLAERFALLDVEALLDDVYARAGR